MLSDDVLLIIFDFYVDEDEQRIEQWKTLAHVCRRWRSVVFQSPHRLRLQLLCTPNTPARDSLSAWPPLPLIVSVGIYDKERSMDNIIAALEHNDRVCQIKFDCFANSPASPFECITNSAAMQKPFPELTHLNIVVWNGNPILPISFLGTTAPRLQSLKLDGVPFPGLPKLLLSATHLVKLDLHRISSGSILPETMATSLSVLTSLENLRLCFQGSQTRSAVVESRRPPPPLITRPILPSLTKIKFEGDSEYLEEILARIDAPRLIDLHVTFLDHDIFDAPQLFQFISRRPTLRASENGYIALNSRTIFVKFPSQTSDHGVLSVEMERKDEMRTSRDEICHSHGISGLENIYIFEERGYLPQRQDNVENSLWLDLLRLFVAVKNLYLSKEFVPRIAPALQLALVRGKTTEVLPNLENIFLERVKPLGPLGPIKKFAAARRLTNHPVAVSRWSNDPENQMIRWNFYYL